MFMLLILTMYFLTPSSIHRATTTAVFEHMHKQLTESMETLGKTVTVRLIRNPESRLPRPFAYVQYETQDLAQKAIEIGKVEFFWEIGGERRKKTLKIVPQKTETPAKTEATTDKAKAALPSPATATPHTTSAPAPTVTAVTAAASAPHTAHTHTPPPPAAAASSSSVLAIRSASHSTSAFSGAAQSGPARLRPVLLPRQALVRRPVAGAADAAPASAAGPATASNVVEAGATGVRDGSLAMSDEQGVTQPVAVASNSEAAAPQAAQQRTGSLLIRSGSRPNASVVRPQLLSTAALKKVQKQNETEKTRDE